LLDIGATGAGGHRHDFVGREKRGEAMLEVDFEHVALQLHGALLGLLLEHGDLGLHVADDLFLFREAQALRLLGLLLGGGEELLALGIEAARDIELQCRLLLFERAAFLAQGEFRGAGLFELLRLLAEACLGVAQFDGQLLTRLGDRRRA